MQANKKTPRFVRNILLRIWRIIGFLWDDSISRWKANRWYYNVFSIIFVVVTIVVNVIVTPMIIQRVVTSQLDPPYVNLEPLTVVPTPVEHAGFLCSDLTADDIFTMFEVPVKSSYQHDCFFTFTVNNESYQLKIIRNDDISNPSEIPIRNKITRNVVYYMSNRTDIIAESQQLALQKFVFVHLDSSCAASVRFDFELSVVAQKKTNNDRPIYLCGFAKAVLQYIVEYKLLPQLH